MEENKTFPASFILLAIAKELAEQAKSSLPDLQEGECIRREWLEDSKFYRETTINGENYISHYDFKEKSAFWRAEVKST